MVTVGIWYGSRMELRTTSRDSQGGNRYKTMTKSMERNRLEGHLGLFMEALKLGLQRFLVAGCTAGLPLEPRQFVPRPDWPLTLGALGESIRFHPCPPAKSNPPSSFNNHQALSKRQHRRDIRRQLAIPTLRYEKHNQHEIPQPTLPTTSNDQPHNSNDLTSLRARARPRTSP